MNPFDIGKPCIKIAKSELLFEQYIMNINRDKYDIEVRDDDALKRNRILFYFMQRTFNNLDGLYMDETFILMNEKNQLREQSAAEVERLEIEKRSETKKRKIHPSVLQKTGFL